MSRIYYLEQLTKTIGDAENRAVQIPTVEYIDEIVSMIENAFKNHINESCPHSDSSKGFEGFQTISPTKVDKMPTGEEVTTIKAEDVQEDSSHKFISETQLQIFKDKPSKLDMENAITDLRNEIKSTINASYDRLLNMPNALEQLRDIAYILQEEESLGRLMELISGKVSADELREHAKSVTHLNNNDRKALNLLLSFIKEGCADWTASKDAPNYIRNKPTSLPANGGNADTVRGYQIEKLLTKRSDDLIIGFDLEAYKYSREEVDYMVELDNSNTAEVMNMLTAYEGKVAIRRGIYIVKDSMIDWVRGDKCNNDLIITGAMSNTYLAFDVRVSGHITLRDLYFANSTVMILRDVKVENVTFDNCEIVMKDSYCCTIRGCTFKGCTFTYLGSCINNFIVENRYTKPMSLSYAGGNNMIYGNMSY